MALGGGTWTAQNKVLPGTYINFSSVQKADASLSERGVVATPLFISWGPTDELFTLSSERIVQDCKKLLGYAYSDPEMLPVRELFRNARTVIAYRCAPDAVKASNDFATARYAGTRGNDIKIVISANVDNPAFFDVSTYLDQQCMDTQTVASADKLADNDFVQFKTESTLAATAGTALTGGSNGGSVTGSGFQAFLTAIERKAFNILACPTADKETVKLFVAYTKRMTAEVGANFQLVCYRPEGAESETVIGVENAVLSGLPAYGLVYWVAGAEAACALNASVTNKAYDGELTIDLNYTQAALMDGLKAGKLMLHDVNGEARVLDDINTLVTVPDQKSEDFKSNQIVRLCNDAANSIAVLFNTRYLGIIPNDANGRISLWNDICKLFQTYEKNQVIENFDTGSVEVLPGETKKSVVCSINALSAISAMGTLYLNVIVA